MKLNTEEKCGMGAGLALVIIFCLASGFSCVAQRDEARALEIDECLEAGGEPVVSAQRSDKIVCVVRQGPV